MIIQKWLFCILTAPLVQPLLKKPGMDKDDLASYRPTGPPLQRFWNDWHWTGEDNRCSGHHSTVSCSSPIACLAKVVLQDSSNSVTCLLSQLHWLPVSKRIQLKIATLTYQLVSFGQPTYLSSVLIPYQPQRSLRSVSVRTCYPYHAASAVLDKEVFPIVSLKSGMSCHFRSDSLLHFIPSSATWKLTILQITDHLATASSASHSALLTYSAIYKLLWMNEWMNEWMRTLDGDSFAACAQWRLLGSWFQTSCTPCRPGYLGGFRHHKSPFTASRLESD